MSVLSSNDIHLRLLEISDYYKQYIDLLSHSYNIDLNKITIEQFTEYVNDLPKNTYIYILEENGIIIGSITLLIETKIIHNFGKVGHIEDVIIHKDYRNKKLGKILCNFCVNKSKEYGCYKVILDCNDDTIGFYKKLNFIKNGNQMCIYF